MDRIESLQNLLANGDESSPADFVSLILDHRDSIKALVKSLDQGVDAFLFQWLQRNQSLTIGEIRYYIGNKSVTKPTQKPQEIFNSLLETLGRDVTAECLASSAWKHGTIKKALADVGNSELFDQMFATEIVQDIATGKPAKEIKKVNTSFIK